MRVAILMAALLLFPAMASPEESPAPEKDCGMCHVSQTGGGLLREPLSGLCIGCHPDRVKADHKVDIVPSMPVEGLPLDGDGRMTCVTCHDPHGGWGIDSMLRVRPKLLCGKCHKK